VLVVAVIVVLVI